MLDGDGRPSLHTPGPDGKPDRRINVTGRIVSDFRLREGFIPVTVTADDGRDDLYAFSLEAWERVASGEFPGRVTDGEGAEVSILDTTMRTPGHPVAAKVFADGLETLRSYSADGACADGIPEHELSIVLDTQERETRQDPAPAAVQAGPPAQLQVAAGVTAAQLVRDIRSRFGGAGLPVMDTVMGHPEVWAHLFSEETMAETVRRLDAMDSRMAGRRG